MEAKSASFTTVIIASVVTCLVFGGLLFTVRQEMREQNAQVLQTQQQTLDTLNKKISALESQTAELAGRPVTDTATIDGLRGELTTAKSTIGELTERIALLEKKPEPAAVPVPAPTAVSAPTASATASLSALKSAVLSGAVYQAELDIWEKEHPKSGDKIVKLRASAGSGLPTEEKLRTQLRELLNRQNSTKESFPDGSLASRINSHLSGLVSIKKQTAVTSDLKPLQDGVESASISTLKSQVAALPDTLKPAFADWLRSAETRGAALNELTTLDVVP